MKRKEFLLFGILSLFLFSCAPAPAQEIQIVQAEQRTISVTGSGEIKVSPDEAEIVFGTYTSDIDVMVAKEENEEISQNILEALKDYGIAEQDIKSDYLGVFSDAADDAPAIYRYGVKTAYKVIVHDITELESIITKVLKLEGVRITGVYFRISELERYQQQVRDLAIQSAKEKARNMVSQFGQEIDLPLSIQEISAYPESSTLFTSSLFGQRNDYYGYDSGSVSFRQVTITSTVNDTYSLKPQ